MPEESSQPTSTGAVREISVSPSTQIGGLKEASAPSPDESEYEITHRDTGVVFGSDSAFSDLSPKKLRVRWRTAMGQLVGDKDLAQLASVPVKTRVNELLALQAEVLKTCCDLIKS